MQEQATSSIAASSLPSSSERSSSSALHLEVKEGAFFFIFFIFIPSVSFHKICIYIFNFELLYQRWTKKIFQVDLFYFFSA